MSFMLKKCAKYGAVSTPNLALAEVHFGIQNAKMKNKVPSEIAERIQSRLKSLGKTTSGAAVEAGLGRSAIRHIIEGKSESPRGKTLTALARVLQTSEQWLLHGTEPNSPLISGYDPFDPDPVQDFDAEAPDPIDPDAAPKIPKNGVVELEAKAGMGDGHIVAHRYVRNGSEITTVDAVKSEYWQFPPAFLALLGVSPTRIVMIQAIGDSMEPTVPAGSMVMIDTGHTRVTPDGVYAIRDREGAIQIKRLETFGVPAGHLRIRSDRTNAAVDVSLHEMTVVGRVILKMSAM